MNAGSGPDAPPPYPVAEMLIALEQAGCRLDQMVGLDIKFGMYMMLMMVELTQAAKATVG